MNRTRKEVLLSTLNMLIGLEIFSFAVYTTIQANIGASPWDVFNLGISGRIHTLYGNVQNTVSITLVLVDLLILREKIGIGTLCNAVIVGKSVDLFNYLNIIPTMTGNIVIRVLVYLAGTFLYVFGQYVYIKPGLSAGPRDSFQVGLAKRIPKISIGGINIIIQATVCLIGWLFGGPVGIGTLISVFGLGPVQEFVFRLLKFNIKGVKHQDIVTSWNILTKKTNKMA